MRRLLACGLLSLVLLAGCADARSSSSSGSPGLPAASGGQGTPVSSSALDRARAYVRERSPIPGWNRGVVVRAVVTGPAENRRWTAAVVEGGGKLVVIDSCEGETDRVVLVVGEGDYVRFRTYFGCVHAPGGFGREGYEKRTVIVPETKGAVQT